MKNRFRLYHKPESIQSRFSILVLDENSEPFLPLMYYYDDQIGRISRSSVTTYLHLLIPFFDWLTDQSSYQGKTIEWKDCTAAIQVAIRDYLISEMKCKVRDKNGIEMVFLTQQSPQSIRMFLSGLKGFYRSMIRLKQYTHPHPLLESNAPLFKELAFSLNGQRSNRPRLPDIAGTENPKEYRKYTDSYFKVVNEEWKPHILDDPELPAKILIAGKLARWSLREEIIRRLLFETGARVSEIIEVTIGDYRARSSIREMNTFSKGSHGRRIKFLAFSHETAILLKRYINGERKGNDRDHLSFDTLPDNAPLFLTTRGTPYTYSSWYPHWKKALLESGLNVNPHKTRHWYVTQMLRTIYETSMSDGETQRRINELIKYMKWESNTTIDTYEHYFDVKRHIVAQDFLFQKMKKDEQVYIKQKRKKCLKQGCQKSKDTTSIISVSNDANDEEIRDLIEGLE
ncbi:site-specific integrase [Brevibacillus sp. MS2.2]|uniref:tyrosine-type recombinase/integrase n=1 Tax=Brevibacillus sp. MS2.2 TaxID=2738981 RepID=UPI00156B7781|nr:site-specific integrase [Brevibacillus sp. MS2.2]NRR22798.1 site-specific integrase [Brevibacillus sp. MS2.2]